MRCAAPILLLLLAACVSAENATPTGPSPRGQVRDIQLGQLRGEVGKVFDGQVTWSDNYIDEPEIDVKGLPPGLFFDPASRSVRGKPTHAGFYTVQISIRRRVKFERNHRPKAEERWWQEEFEVEVYTPLKP